MAAIDVKVIEELLVHIDALIRAIQTAGDVGRIRLQDIKVDEVRKAVLKNAAELDAAAWSQFPEDEQNELHHRLTLVRDSLQIAAGLDGPMNPKHIMHATYASNISIVLWALIGFLLTGGLLYAIAGWWSEATGADFAAKIQAAAVAIQDLESARDRAAKVNAAEGDARIMLASAKDDETPEAAKESVKTQAQQAIVQRLEVENAEKKASLAAIEAIQAIQKGGATERSVLIMVILLGALGGTLHFVSSLVKFIGNRQLTRSWLPYYLSIPITGAALAPIVYMMLRVGILAPSGVSGDGSSVANLNLIGIYAFAALTGLFAKTATTKLAEVFNTIFRTEEPPSKDPIGSEKPPGGNPSAAG
jgi:hypothetical protein